jgi:hypothetical protein
MGLRGWGKRQGAKVGGKVMRKQLGTWAPLAAVLALGVGAIAQGMGYDAGGLLVAFGQALSGGDAGTVETGKELADTVAPLLLGATALAGVVRKMLSMYRKAREADAHVTPPKDAV